ncbi:MAG: VWA domain-containing protein [Aeromicrobium sp.]|uniref:vWA domain-containing protein n=1 Tax=Aeromicrobium sp. TaxID=1871063 RepID=UPI0039E6C507
MLRFITASALLILATVTGWPAQADETAPASEAPVGRLMLVLDASGSMAEPTGDGATRIEAAREALHAVIDQLPDDQQVGMRVFGATVDPAVAGGTTESCTDSQRVVDLGADNREELAEAVDAYQPLGETPVGHALSEAGKDLGDEGQRSIILVSDGEPNCEPDPCVVAADLSDSGVAVRVDVVGLNVAGVAREKLQCVADAGGGTYYDADDTDSLVDSLTTAQTRSSRPFDFTGEPVEGAPEATGAPVIEPGVWLDALPSTGAKWYRVPRTVEGSTIHVGTMMLGAAYEAGTGAHVSLLPEPDGMSCDDASAYGATLGERAPILTASGDTWKSDPADECNTAGEIWLKVEGSGSGDVGGHPISLYVYEEPPVSPDALDALPDEPESPAWTALTPADDPEEGVVPGTSFINAPIVSDGSYALDVNPGETQVIGVPLDWNESVQAQLDASLTAQIADAAAAGSDITIDVVGPLLSESAVSFYGDQPEDWSDPSLVAAEEGDPLRIGAQSQVIAYRNRAQTDSEVEGAALPGVHYIRVTHNVRGDDANLPYTLTIKTTDSGGDHAPAYEEARGLTPPQADSRLVDMAWVEQNAPAEGGSSAAGEGGDTPWLTVGLGSAGGLTLLGAAAVVVRSRLTAHR